MAIFFTNKMIVSSEENMISFTLKMPSKRNFIICAVCIISVIVIAAFVAQGGGMKGIYDSIDNQVEYARSFGWDVSKKPVKVQKFYISDILDEDLKRYNEIQLSQGFDLREFTGCEVVRYSYSVNNYPHCPSGILLNLTMCEGYIVAADIQSVEGDGFIHSVKIPQ